MSFKDKVCVVTGGANGIGLCIVNEFAKKGSKVAFIDLDKKAGEKVLANVKAIGSEGLFFCGDIAEKAALKSFVNEVIKTNGSIDYLINNACLSRKGTISDCDYDDFNYVLKVGSQLPICFLSCF